MKTSRWLAWVSWGILGFLYLPMLLLLFFSFNASKYSASWEGWTLHWYRELLHRQDILSSAGNSLWVAFFSSSLATFLGGMAALALERFSWKRKLWWLIPMFVVFTIIGILIVFVGSSPLAPIVYPLF